MIKKRSSIQGFIGKVLSDILPEEEILENDRSVIINPATKKHLELDFYIPKFNIGIEVQGKQHIFPALIFSNGKYVKAVDNLTYQKWKDRIKKLSIGSNLIKINFGAPKNNYIGLKGLLSKISSITKLQNMEVLFDYSNMEQLEEEWNFIRDKSLRNDREHFEKIKALSFLTKQYFPSGKILARSELEEILYKIERGFFKLGLDSYYGIITFQQLTKQEKEERCIENPEWFLLTHNILSSYKRISKSDRRYSRITELQDMNLKKRLEEKYFKNQV